MPPQDADRILPGTLLAGRYEVDRELGRGGMATVWAVRDIRTDRKLALKVLKRDIATHPEAVERFRREGEFLQGLKHPALVTVDAVGTLEDGRLFLAMERLEGETLGDRIRRGPMSPAEVSPILAGAAVGLDAAHRAGVIHRDLKPDNVFLATSPNGMQVKLLDFGISKIDGRASLTRTGQVLGTPRYMAPEQLRGEDDLDERVDIYALGVICYEALSGTPAFPAQNPNELILSILNGKLTPLRALRPTLGQDLEAVVLRAMAKAREARFASAIELAQAWFDVVHQHDGPQSVRTGVTTDAFGSALDSLRPPPAVSDDMRPATFRDYEARAVPRPAPVPAVGDVRARVEPAPPAPPAVAPTPVSAPRKYPESRPRGRQRVSIGMLVVAAVAFVAVGIGVGLFFARRANPGTTVRSTPGAAVVAAFPGIVRVPASVDAGRPEVDGSPVPEPISTSSSVDAGSDATSIDVGLRQATPIDEGRSHADRSTTLSQGAVLLAGARAAAGEGDARKCVEIATEAIAAGAEPSAYRLRGDCYRALGDVARALRSYQRFCAIAPRSSQLAAVARSAQELGGTCP